MKKRNPHNAAYTSGGYTLLLVIFFGATLAMIVSALVGRVLVEQDAEAARVANVQSHAIAEAGIEYYRWYLAHNPNDITHGTGEPGPHVIPYEDLEEGEVGAFEIALNENAQCGRINSIEISSTGRSYARPAITTTLIAKYTQPSVANYSYIVDDNVYVGSDRTIQGPYHSNGGIHMEGSSNSEVTSATEEWYCTGSYGCDPSQDKPGIWGDGEDQDLWSFPVAQFDFAGISQDFFELKDLAQADGLFFEEAEIETGSPWRPSVEDGEGYRIVFQGDGTIDVYGVERVGTLSSIQVDGSGWAQDPYIVQREQYQGTYTIPQDCALIYVEDNLWVSGTVTGKVAIVASPPDSWHRDGYVVLEDDITYETGSEEDGLTLVSKGNIALSPNSPEDMTLEGIFITQEGSFGRNLYRCTLGEDNHQGSLTINGSIISKKRVGTKWVPVPGEQICGENYAGYENRTNTYDRKLAADPPPFTPVISPDYQFIEWREE